jgi:hypothetical protein
MLLNLSIIILGWYVKNLLKLMGNGVVNFEGTMYYLGQDMDRSTNTNWEDQDKRITSSFYQYVYF